MAVTSDTLRILINGGKGNDEFLLVAEACERGDDMRAIHGLIDELHRLEANDKVIAIAICGLAESINEANRRFVRRIFRDEHSEQKDSNRSRRGMPDNEWRALRQRVFARDGYECQYCGHDEDLTCDHIVPLVRGGSNDIENLTTACRPCNSSKGDKLLSEWRGLIVA